MPESYTQFLVGLASSHVGRSLLSVTKVAPLPFWLWAPQSHSRGCPETLEFLRKPARVESWKQTLKASGYWPKFMWKWKDVGQFLRWSWERWLFPTKASNKPLGNNGFLLAETSSIFIVAVATPSCSGGPSPQCEGSQQRNMPSWGRSEHLYYL